MCPIPVPPPPRHLAVNTPPTPQTCEIVGTRRDKVFVGGGEELGSKLVMVAVC